MTVLSPELTVVAPPADSRPLRPGRARLVWALAVSGILHLALHVGLHLVRTGDPTPEPGPTAPIEVAFISAPEQKPSPPPSEPVVEPPAPEPEVKPPPPPPEARQPVRRPPKRVERPRVARLRPQPPVAPPPAKTQPPPTPVAGPGTPGPGRGMGLVAAEAGPGGGLTVARAGTGAARGQGTGGSGQGPGVGPGPRPVADMQGYGRQVRQRVLKRKRYPLAARRMRFQGEALVQVVLDRSGALVGKPRLLRSTRHECLDDEALRMVQAARPFPALPAGWSQATAAFVIPIKFGLDNR